MAGPAKSRQRLWKSLQPTAIRAQLSHSRAGVAVTPSWLCGYTCLASVCITATVYCQSMYAASWILPRHQHLWCYFYAEGGAIEVYCNRAVCHSVRLLQVFLVAHWKLRAETNNTSRYRYLLGFVFKNFRFKASFVSYGVICLPC